MGHQPDRHGGDRARGEDAGDRVAWTRPLRRGHPGIHGRLKDDHRGTGGPGEDGRSSESGRGSRRSDGSIVRASDPAEGLLQRPVAEAADQMVIDHPHRLHERIADGRPDELEAALQEVACSSASDFGVSRPGCPAIWPPSRPYGASRRRTARCRRRSVPNSFCTARNACALRHAASIFRRLRMMPGSGEQRASTCAASILRDLARIETGRTPCGTPSRFLRIVDPAQSGLRPLEHQQLEQAPIVMHRHAPLFIMVGDQSGSSGSTHGHLIFMRSPKEPAKDKPLRITSCGHTGGPSRGLRAPAARVARATLGPQLAHLLADRLGQGRPSFVLPLRALGTAEASSGERWAYPLARISLTCSSCLRDSAASLPRHRSTSGCREYPLLLFTITLHMACSSLCSASRWFLHRHSTGRSQMRIGPIRTSTDLSPAPHIHRGQVRRRPGSGMVSCGRRGP